MTTVTLDVTAREGVTRRALEAFRGKRRRARIGFATLELLRKVLTAKHLVDDYVETRYARR